MSILAKSGLAELRNRRVLQVYGRDASKYIQAILTNDMKRMEGPGDALYGAFLAPKGRVLGDCHVIQTTDDTFLLEYDDAINEQMLKHWKRYKIRMKVTLEDKTGELKSVAAFPATLPSDTDANVLDNPSALLQSVKELNSLDGADSGVAYMDPRGATFGVRVIVPSGMQVQKPEGYDDMDLQAYTDRRVFLGAGEGHELVDNIPLEVNLELLGGVSFRKGCYVGQELTARTQFKGNVRKRLLPVAMVPSSETDLVDALQDIPFGRIDDASHAPLRDFLANTAAANLTSALGDGVKIVKPDSTKAVGTVRASADGIHAALAMVRLQHLLPTEDKSRPMRFQTADGGFHAIPYEPAWWPPLDVETGKMLL